MITKTFQSLLSLAVCVLIFSGCAAPSVKNTSHSFTTVVVDAGHGGHDSGAIRNHVAEKGIALDVAQRLAGRLRNAGFHVVMTRNGDYFVELDERAAVSNRQHNAIFVSIHFNDGARRVHGAQVYYHSVESMELARRIEDKMGAITTKAGVPHANFRVLRKNHYPAVLVECGFLSNRREAAHCASGAYRQQIADRIADALVEQRGEHRVAETASPAGERN